MLSILTSLGIGRLVKILTHYQTINFRLVQIERVCRGQFQNGRQCGKRLIACYEQFLLFPQCFQKAYFPGASKGVIVWEWVNLWLVK